MTWSASETWGWPAIYLFPNEASLLRLVTAVLVEVSDDWETGRVYLQLATT